MAMTFSVNEAQFGNKMISAILKNLDMNIYVNISNVCIWAMFSRDNAAWNRVILRDTEVKSWRLLLSELARHRTTELDMMGVIMSDPKLRLTADLRILKTLRVLRTDPTTNTFLKMIQSSLPQLKELRSTCISSHLQLDSLEKMTKLRVLRIRMTHPRTQAHSLDNVASLKCLTELSICGVTNMEVLNTNLLTVDFGRKVLPHLRALRSPSNRDIAGR